MKHILFKSFYLFLAIMMLINVSFVTPLAVIDNLGSESIDEASIEEKYVVSEETALRGEYEKHYVMSDGSMVVTTYDEPIHYYEENEWKDIDNTLQFENGVLKNTKNNLFNVEIDAYTNGNDSVTIYDDELSLKWSYRLFDKKGVVALNACEKIDYNTVDNTPLGLSNKKITVDDISLTKLNTNAKYTYSFNDSTYSVEHTLGSKRVGEKITFENSKSALPIVIDFEYTDLIPTIVNGKYIVFYDTDGNKRFSTSVIDVVDDSVDEILSYNISLSETETGCTVVIVPEVSLSRNIQRIDKDLLTKNGNEYSVCISVSPSNSPSNIEATYVHEGDTAGEHANEVYMYAGIYQGKLSRCYVKFLNMPSIPTNATVFYAELVLNLRTSSTGDGGYSARRVSSSWSEKTISFANQPGYDYLALDSNVPYDKEEKISHFNVTSAIYGFYNIGVSYYGFMISFTDEKTNDYNAFCTDNHSLASSRPALIINYNPEYETENNNSISTANPIGLVCEHGGDSYIRGYLSSNTDVDYYELTPPRHGRVHVSLAYPYEYSSGNYIYTPYNIEIVDEKGKVITTTTFIDSKYNKTLTFTALNGDPDTGRQLKYYIKISSKGTVSTGAYRLTVFYPLNYYNLDWQYPLDPLTRKISSPVGFRTFDNKYHTGIDIPGTTSNVVYSACKGIVVDKGYVADGGGNYLVISTKLDDGTGQRDEYTKNYFTIRYLHFNSIDSNIKIGTIVEKGQRLGYMGKTGYAEDVHLHIDVNTGEYKDVQGIRSDYESIINPVDLFSDDIRFTDNVYYKKS